MSFYIYKTFSNIFRVEGNTHLLFMELASNGELYHRIVPDVGIKESDSRNIFCQLLDGVEYLHNKGFQIFILLRLQSQQ